MSDPLSIICFVRLNYKFFSSIVCVVYLIISTICLFKFALNINHEYPQFLCNFVAGGAKASIGLFISSVTALFGMVLDSPFLIVPLLLMHIIVFAMIKLLFVKLIMGAIHGPNPSMILAVSLCISFVVVSLVLALIFWLIYCTFIQISMTVWPDSPISCRAGRRDNSTTTASSTTAKRNDGGNPSSSS